MRKTWLAIITVVLFMDTGGNIAFAEGYSSRGKTLFANCVDCHAIKKGAPRRVGPNLFGIVGRKLGAEPDFDYPQSHVSAGRNGYEWTEQSLFQYLKDPIRFMRLASGKAEGDSLMLHMILRLPNARDRKDLIAYLKTRR